MVSIRLQLRLDDATRIGHGKVAQFTTYSYPASGFALMCVVAACMALAALIRRSMPVDARD